MSSPIHIRRGKTFILPLRLSSKPFIYKAISAISATDPVRIDTTAVHGLTDGWPAVVVGAKGMRQVNTVEFDQDGWPSQMYPVTVIDTNTIEFNDVRASGFTAYLSGGALMFPTPFDLTAISDVRMQVKDHVGGAVLATFNLADEYFTIDTSGKVITLELPADETAAFDWSKGVTDIEAQDSDDRVWDLLGGPRRVVIDPEVTTAEEV